MKISIERPSQRRLRVSNLSDDQSYISLPINFYATQLLSESVKVYCMFRLSKQRWENRGNQSAGMEGGLDEKIRSGMTSWVTAVWLGALVIFVCLFCNILKVPSYQNFLSDLASK